MKSFRYSLTPVYGVFVFGIVAMSSRVDGGVLVVGCGEKK